MISKEKKAKAKENSSPSVAKLLSVIFLFLTAVSILSRVTVGIIIEEYTKKQVIKQADIITEIFKKRLDGEIERLNTLSKAEGKSIIRVGEENAKDTGAGNFGITAASGDYAAKIGGMYIEDYKARYPAVFDDTGGMIIYSIFEAVSGETYITYYKVPHEELESYFGIDLKENDWNLVLTEHSDDDTVMILFHDTDTPVYRMEQSKGSAAWAGRVNGEDCYFFSAEVKGTPFVVNGYTPKDTFSSGIRSVTYTYVATLILLMASILIAFYALYRAHSRSAKYKKAEHEKEIAEAANIAKSEFLSQISHEIRTPINAMLGMNELIMRESNEPATIDYAQKSQDAGSTLLCLVNDILDFSKIEAGQMSIVNDAYKLSEVIRTVDSTIRPRAESKGLEFELTVDEEIPNNLVGDKTRVTQIFLNLLTNAVKYTEQGSIHAALNYTGCEDGITIRFSVEDTGIGIREEDIPGLFQKFQRVDLKHNSAIEGTGLGLSITKDLTNRMGGDVTVESTYGEGSTFICWFKQGIEENADIYKNREEKMDGKTLYAPGISILAVDDTMINLVLLKGLFKNTGVSLDTAESGEECLKCVKEKVYDIIFLDIRMPGIDGVETLRRMKAEGFIKNTPVIALTANTSSGYEGFTDCLLKPFHPGELYSMVVKHIETASIIDDKRPEVSEELSCFSKINGIDATHGLSMCGTSEIYLEALENYANSANSYTQEIQKALEIDDYETFARITHTIKSSSNMIGAVELSEKAKRLEKAGDEKNDNLIRVMMPKFMSTYRRLAAEIAACMKKEDVKGEISEEDVPGLAKHMEDYIDDFNDDAIGSMIHALDQYRWPRKYLQKFDALKAANTAADWVKMKEIVTSMQENF